MRISKYIIAPALLFASSLSMSCSDFLTEVNPSEQTVEEYWTTVASCETALTSVYNALKNTSNFAFVDDVLRSDLAVQGVDSRTSFTNVCYLQTFTDAYTTTNSKWAAHYTGIYRANQVIEGVETVRNTVTLSNDNRITLQDVEAQAYLFRGLFYFWLHNSYNEGSVPIFDFVPVQPDELYQPLSTSDEVKEFYRADILKAIELGIPSEWTETEDVGRLTLGLANTLLGLSYLYDGEYETAEEYLKEVIDSGVYSLAGIADNHTTQAEMNSESILEASYTLDYNSEQSGESFLSHYLGMLVASQSYGGWCSMVPAFWLTETFEYEPVNAELASNWSEVEVETYTHKSSTGTETTYTDMIVETAGGRMEYSTISSGTEKFVTFVVPITATGTNVSNHSGSIDFDSGEVTHGGVIYQRVVSRDATTGELLSNSVPTYSIASSSGSPAYYYNTLKYDKNTEAYYRLCQYSPRATTYITINGDEEVPCYGDSASIAPRNGKPSYFKNYSNWDIWEMENENVNTNYSGINLRLLRLADVYLAYAEALIKGGDDESGASEALRYINRIRYRAGTTLINDYMSNVKEYSDATYDYQKYDVVLDTYEDPIDSAADIMDHLMYVERPLELTIDGCGQRVTDLRRWGITSARFKYLATQKFQFSNRTYIRMVDDVPTAYDAWYLPLREFQSGTTYVDFESAAANYNSTKAYWPIPSVEKTANPYIN